jgi:hypothetical protein
MAYEVNQKYGDDDKSNQTKDIAKSRQLWKEFEAQGMPESSLVPWTVEELQ